MCRAAALPGPNRQKGEPTCSLLELETGEEAEPATFVTAVPGWRSGDQVLIRPGLPAALSRRARAFSSSSTSECEVSESRYGPDEPET